MKQRLVIGGVGAIFAALWLASADVAAQAQAAPAGRVRATLRRPAGQRSPGFQRHLGGHAAPRRVPDAFDPKTGNYRTTSDNTRTGNPVDFERDPGIRMRMFARENKPWYKPEYWERVMFNDVHGHSQLAPDPTFQCMPAGVPRIGLPQEILQNDKQMVFLYPLHQRRIYIDGRPHPPEEQWLGTWFGHSVGTLGRRHAGDFDRRLQRPRVARMARMVHDSGQASDRAHASRRQHPHVGSGSNRLRARCGPGSRIRRRGSSTPIRWRSSRSRCRASSAICSTW